MCKMSHNALRSPTPLEQLLEEINFQRKKELHKCSQDPGFISSHTTTYWTDMFVRHFLFQADQAIDSDDLLFFVRKHHINLSNRLGPKYETEVEVFRRDSKKLPIGDPDIDWEETVYLNLVIHQFDYKITLAVCTRTSPKDLQVLKRNTQMVYASPSRRRMDTKGEFEEMTYPNVCFMVDNFDEVFGDLVVRDGEMVAAELVASDRKGNIEVVIFLGSIQFDALKRIHDSRISQQINKKLSYTNLCKFFTGQSQRRIEFVRMIGPHDEGGHAEIAVTRPKGHAGGVETPTSEPGTCLTDSWCDSDAESDCEEFMTRSRRRRLSDPSANVGSYVTGNATWRGGTRSGRNSGVGRGDAENIDSACDGIMEIRGGDIRDELDDGAYNPLWTMRGYTQTFHFWKEHKRAQCVPLNTYLTYISLPWWSIISDILNKNDQPILTF